MGHLPGDVPRPARPRQRRWCSWATPSSRSTPSVAPTCTPTSPRCAAPGTGRPPTLGTNWRSDGAVLRANAALLDGVTFGDAVHRASPTSTPSPAHIRTGASSTRTARRCRRSTCASRSGRRHRAHDQERHARRQGRPRGHHRRPGRTGSGAARRRRCPCGRRRERPGPRVPSDIAVLVRSNDDATNDPRRAAAPRACPPCSPAAAACSSRRRPTSGAGCSTPWRGPSDPVRARTFALSWFGGRSADWVAAADDDDLVGAAGAARRVGRRCWPSGGVIEFQRRLWADTERRRPRAGPPRRRPRAHRPGARRRAARHRRRRRAPERRRSAVRSSTPRRRRQIDADIDRDQAARRVESEAEAVQVMTVWVAKGLEFPIVCVPTMWSTVPRHADRARTPTAPSAHACTTWRRRRGPTPRPRRSARRSPRPSTSGENLRLLYVALTRAQHQTIVWWTSVSTAARPG